MEKCSQNILVPKRRWAPALCLIAPFLGLFPKETNSTKTKSSSFRYNPFTGGNRPIYCLLTYPIKSHTKKIGISNFEVLTFENLSRPKLNK